MSFLYFSHKNFKTDPWVSLQVNYSCVKPCAWVHTRSASRPYRQCRVLWVGTYEISIEAVQTVSCVGVVVGVSSLRTDEVHDLVFPLTWCLRGKSGWITHSIMAGWIQVEIGKSLWWLNQCYLYNSCNKTVN